MAKCRISKVIRGFALLGKRIRNEYVEEGSGGEKK